MLKFVAANLGLMKSSLLPAMQKTHRVQKSSGVHPYMSLGLGWHVMSEHGTEIVWHGGETGGYNSFIGFDKKKRLGVVVMSNSANAIDDIGLHLLESKYELMTYRPPEERKAIKLDHKIYDDYVGRYELAPELVISVTRDGDRFYVEATGQSKVEIFAESETKFYTPADTQFIFLKDEKEQATHLTMRKNGQDYTMKRIK